MFIEIVTLFPEIFFSAIKYGITGRAIKKKLLNIRFWNPNKYAFIKKINVDDRPYGSGPGMVMTPEPIFTAINKAKLKVGQNVRVIYLSPQGKILNHQSILKLIKYNKFILICGRYEGIDERIINSEVDEELSIGDYVLSGGELAAMVFIDSISRFIPGVLGNNKSFKNDSFFNGFLDYPNYTRPKIFRNMEVPSVLLSGNHFLIKRWRKKQSIGRTWCKRPEIFKKIILSKYEKLLLEEFKKEMVK